VPESTHAVDKLSPAGSDGLELQLVIAPPELVGVCVVIAVPLTKVNGLPEKLNAGKIAWTVIETAADDEPLALVAVTVYVASDATEVGVPVIAQLDVSKLNPLESDGEIAQLTCVPPVLPGVTVEIAVPTV
jgi:hypothetical protein